METQEKLVGVNQCLIAKCNQAAEVRLGDEALCRQHFLATCVNRLNAVDYLLARQSGHHAELDQLQELIVQCAKAATALMCQADNLDPLLHTNLLDVLFRAIDTSRKLRGSNPF